MKRFAITVFAAVSLADAASAFTTIPSRALRPSPRLYSVKKTGGGIATQAPGDLSLYDPNEAGLLQGTNDLMNRLEGGASFGAGVVQAEAEELPTAPTPEPEPVVPTPIPQPPSPAFTPKTTNLKQLLNGQTDLGTRGRRGGSSY